MTPTEAALRAALEGLLKWCVPFNPCTDPSVERAREALAAPPHGKDAGEEPDLRSQLAAAQEEIQRYQSKPEYDIAWEHGANAAKQKYEAQIERCRKAVEPFRDESGDWVDWVERIAEELSETRKLIRVFRPLEKPRDVGRTCSLPGCGGEIGPDVTGRPMCYRCGPPDMRPSVADP